jgi:hypothetical protein
MTDARAMTPSRSGLACPSCVMSSFNEAVGKVLLGLRTQVREWQNGQHRPAGCLLVPNRHGKSVTAPRQRLDVARRARVVSDDMPKLAYGTCQRVVSDSRAFPDAIEQLSLVDHPALMGDQIHQHVERPWTEGAQSASLVDAVVRRVDDDVIEFEARAAV